VPCCSRTPWLLLLLLKPLLLLPFLRNHLLPPRPCPLRKRHVIITFAVTALAGRSTLLLLLLLLLLPPHGFPKLGQLLPEQLPKQEFIITVPGIATFSCSRRRNKSAQETCKHISCALATLSCSRGRTLHALPILLPILLLLLLLVPGIYPQHSPRLLHRRLLVSLQKGMLVL
jgi:hypothetical protein